ncbi:DASH complex subunit Dad4-domain-containing protein [Fusarium solani]|uniref:DASH complex subunit DAD4 n=1 Tax=Fusarium solani TaxID=169388 RepID=A0A9P9L7X5_FUSSL|nr:DASH complex subunit Dad4-domain-containing protein [Fusarium solani]KAH7275540.1 DASH complex subunit Dad4-domain-containing protein [Fusarium solani]
MGRSCAKTNAQGGRSKQEPHGITLGQDINTCRLHNLQKCPHEHQQNLLLSRIITNVEKLNEAVVVMNKSLQDINIQNMNVELVAQMFKNYQSNVLFHLEATDNLKPPN